MFMKFELWLILVPLGGPICEYSDIGLHRASHFSKHEILKCHDTPLRITFGSLHESRTVSGVHNITGQVHVLSRSSQSYPKVNPGVLRLGIINIHLVHLLASQTVP